MELKFYTDDDGDFIVEGIASTGNIDSSKEIVDPNAIKKSIDSYMKYGLIKEMHERSKVIGKAKEVYQDELGRTIIKFIVVGDEIIEKIKKGIYQALSIGFVSLKSMIKDGKKTHTEIKWVETSLVDIPCNEDCMITNFKALDYSELTDVEDNSEQLHEQQEMITLSDIKSMLSEVLSIVKKDMQSDVEEMKMKLNTFESEFVTKKSELENELNTKYNQEIELIKKEYEDKLNEQKTNYERVLSQKINQTHASVIEDQDEKFNKKYKNNEQVKALYNIFK